MADLKAIGQSIKAKYPQYEKIDDEVLGAAVLKKYPSFGETTKSTVPGYQKETPAAYVTPPTPTTTPPPEERATTVTPPAAVAAPVEPQEQKQVKPSAYGQYKQLTDVLFPSAVYPTSAPTDDKSFMQKAGGFLTEHAPTIGGIIGGTVGGIAAGPFGAVPLAGAFSAAGEAIKRKAKGESVSPDSLQKAAASGAIAEGVGLGVGKIVGGIGKAVYKSAAKMFTKATNAQAAKVLTEHGDDITNIAQKYIPKGKTYDDVLGKEGVFNKILSGAETQIQTIAKNAKEVIPVDDIVVQLQKQRDLIATQIGSGKKLAAIDKLISEAQKKYKYGIRVSDALKTLRAGNEAFGRNVLDVDTTDAVVSAAQKIETNAIRNALKMRFQGIANALDIQSDILSIRPVIEAAWAKSKNTTVDDIMRGFSIVNPADWLKVGPLTKHILEIPEKMPGAPGGIAQGAAKLGTQALTQPITSAVIGAKPDELPKTPTGTIAAPEAEGLVTTPQKEPATTTRTIEQINREDTEARNSVRAFYQKLRESGKYDEKAIDAKEKATLDDLKDTYEKRLAEYKEAKPKDSASIEKRKLILNQAAPVLHRVVSAAMSAPTGMEGAIRATAGKIPGVEGGEAEYLERDITGFARLVATAFASEVGVATDKDINRWLGLMPRPGDTRNERIRQSIELIRQIESEAKSLGVSIPDDIITAAKIIGNIPDKYPQKHTYR